MKKPVFSVLLLALSVIGPVSTATSAAATPSVAPKQSKTTSFETNYERGARLGADDAKAVKCSNPGGFEQWYYENRQLALDNGYGSDSEYAEFWSGYYVGLENGYYSQVNCGGTSGPGGPGGPIGEPPVDGY